MTKNDFESDLVRSLNFHLRDNGISYRLKQSEYTNQIVDILIDSVKYGYLFIECKSIDYKKFDRLYFNGRFSDGQIEGIEGYRKKSGRKGFLFVELRTGSGNRNIVCVYNWDFVIGGFRDGKKHISFDDSILNVIKIGDYHDLGRFFSTFM